ncbi:MAG: hypothetical protein ACKVU4_13240 [Phycisphaerales bacterium]
MTTAPTAHERLLDRVKADASASGVFGPVVLREGPSGALLVCPAKDAAEPASYRLAWEGGRLWVSLVTADRWLSESIEADLMHTGDKIEELIEEELVDLGVHPAPFAVEHFRSDDLLFTFRTAVPLPAGPQSPDSARVALIWLLGYEAAFRRLGDMAAGEEAE